MISCAFQSYNCWMAAFPRFHSNAAEALKKIHKGSFASSVERDELIEAALAGSEKFRAKDVVWMLFRPDRAVRDAGAKLLQPHRELSTFDAFIAASKGMPDAALKTASGVVFSLEIPGVRKRLEELAGSKNEELAMSVRQIVLGAPPIPALAPLLWRLAMKGALRDRIQFLDRLSSFQPSEADVHRWQHLARTEEKEVRERALVVLATQAPEASLDLIVAELPRTDYGVQQYLIEALTNLANVHAPPSPQPTLLLMPPANPKSRF